MHVEVFRKFHHLFGVSRSFPGAMPGAATLGADQLGQKLGHSASVLEHEVNMSLRRDGPHIEPLLD